MTQKPNDIQAVVFDLDGTLVDSMTGFAQVAGEVMAKIHGCDRRWAEDNYLLTSGLPFPSQLEVLFPADARNAQAVELFDRSKREHYHEFPFYNDTLETLKTLKEEGYSIAISSNNEHHLVKMKLKPLGEYLDFLAGFKPGFMKGRAHFEAINRHLALTNSQLVFVGDSLHDGIIAEEGHVHFVAKAGTFPKAAFETQGIAGTTITHLQELPSVLKNLGQTNLNWNSTLPSPVLEKSLPVSNLRVQS